MDPPRTIKVKCATWDQVEAFYTQKVKGDLFVLRMPQPPKFGQAVVVALVLPNGLVFAMDGQVAKLGEAEPGGKVPVAMRLSGLTAEARLRLVRLVDEGRRGSSPNLQAELHGIVAAASSETVPTPTPADAPVDEPVAPQGVPQASQVLADERPVFAMLEEVRRRHQQQAAHEVIGVAEDANLLEIRKAYFLLAKTFHPDVYGKYHSRPVRQLASEVFLHVNRAYDRLRQARAELGDTAPGPARRPQLGWFAEIAELVSAGSSLPVVAETDEVTFESAVRSPLTAADLVTPTPEEDRTPAPPDVFAPRKSVPPAELSGLPPGMAEVAGRESLAKGHYEEARERLAEGLRADPRNRKLRALYHVASGMEARSRGKDTDAQIHFETALRHDKDCHEARKALERVEEKRGIFSRLWGR